MPSKKINKARPKMRWIYGVLQDTRIDGLETGQL